MARRDHIGPRAKHLGILMEQAMGQYLGELDMTPVQSQILHYLIHHQQEPQCQRDVEHYFSLAHPTVSGILSRLEEKGYIRTEKDQKDQRKKILLVTGKAMEYHDQIIHIVRTAEQQCVQGFTPQEREQFLSFLDRAIANLGGNCCKKEGNKG